MRRLDIAQGLVFASLLTGLFAPAATGAPITFSTSGAIGSDQTDQSLHGVSQAASGGLISLTGLDGVSREFMPIGYVNVRPTDGFDGVGFPSFRDFDVHVDFGAGLPSLEIKGTIVPTTFSDLTTMWAGRIDSITSSAPSLNSELPAPFVQIIQHPENGYVGIAADDWELSKLTVYAVSQSSPLAVPEPASLLVFGACAASLLALRRGRRRG